MPHRLSAHGERFLFPFRVPGSAHHSDIRSFKALLLLGEPKALRAWTCAGDPSETRSRHRRSDRGRNGGFDALGAENGADAEEGVSHGCGDGVGAGRSSCRPDGSACRFW